MKPIIAVACLALAAVHGCGGSKPARSADDEATDTADAEAPAEAGAIAAPAAPGGSDDGTSKVAGNPCMGFELDLVASLSLSACEAFKDPNTKPADVKDSLVVTAMVDAASVAPGGHADVRVTLKNKSAAPLALDFVVDPTPRFSIEAFNAKTNKRVDMPPGAEPKLPKGADPRVPGEAKLARITLPPNGTASTRVPWDAVKTRWAPEKLKGTPPEMGYPRAPAGSLPRGKYNLRVVTPLTNVFEGIDHEVSAPRTTVEVR